PPDHWPARRVELLTELLEAMSTALGYSFDRADIQSGSYYPRGYGDAEADNLATRKLWLSILQHKHALPVLNVYPPTEDENTEKEGEGQMVLEEKPAEKKAKKKEPKHEEPKARAEEKPAEEPKKKRRWFGGKKPDKPGDAPADGKKVD